MRDNLLNHLRREDLSPVWRIAVDKIGLDAVRILMEHFDADDLYIQNPQKIVAVVRRYVLANIEERADGSSNVRELARELGVEPRTVRRWLREGREGS